MNFVGSVPWLAEARLCIFIKNNVFDIHGTSVYKDHVERSCSNESYTGEFYADISS